MSALYKILCIRHKPDRKRNYVNVIIWNLYVSFIWKTACFRNQGSMGNFKDRAHRRIFTNYFNRIGSRRIALHCIPDFNRIGIGFTGSKKISKY